MRIYFCSVLTIVISIAFVSPVSVVQAADPIARGDGFELLWDTIIRPYESIKKPAFTDLPDTPQGKKIAFAAYRKILDGSGAFQPMEPLALKDALLWLVRTRNVDDVDDETYETLPMFLEKYKVLQHLKIDLSDIETGTITREELQSLITYFDNALATEVVEASLYSEKFHGKGTAFGETFDMNALTAAHKYLPHNTIIEVTNLDNGKKVMTRVNDRGPFVHEQRKTDLSLASFLAIAERSKGKIPVTIKRLGDARLLGYVDPSAATTCVVSDKYQRRVSGRLVLDPGLPTILPLGHNLITSAKVPFVVRTAQLPDGSRIALNDWVLPGEKFVYEPRVEGEYRFHIAPKTGRAKWMTVKVKACGN